MDKENQCAQYRLIQNHPHHNPLPPGEGAKTGHPGRC